MRKILHKRVLPLLITTAIVVQLGVVLFLGAAASTTGLDLTKNAEWVPDVDIPTAKVELSVSGEPQKPDADIVVLLDRGPGMFTTWCVNPEHYESYYIESSVTYGVQTGGGWDTAEDQLKITLTTHLSGSLTASPFEIPAKISVDGYRTMHNSAPVTAYSSNSSGANSWGTAKDWDWLLTNGDTNLQAFIKSVISDKGISTKYPLNLNDIVNPIGIDWPSQDWDNDCKSPLHLGYDAAKEFALSTLQNTDDNVALISFGPGKGSLGSHADDYNSYLRLFAGFNADENDWETLADLSGDNGVAYPRYTLGLQAAKFYLATQGGYDLLDPLFGLSQIDLSAYSTFSMRQLANALVDSPIDSTLWALLNRGVLSSNTGRVPYFVMISSYLRIDPLDPQAGLSQFNGFAVDTTGVEVHAIGFEAHDAVVTADNILALSKGYGGGAGGHNSTLTYPGHKDPDPLGLSSGMMPKHGGSYSIYPGSYFPAVVFTQDLTNSFSQLERLVRPAGRNAVVEDIIGDGFVLDEDRAVVAVPDTIWEYDPLDNKITWRVGAVSDEPSTLTYYIKADPAGGADLSLLDGNFVDTSGSPFMFANNSAQIEYDDIFGDRTPEDFPMPKLNVKEISYEVEYYLEGLPGPFEVETVTGWVPLHHDPLITSDQYVKLDPYLLDPLKYFGNGYILDRIDYTRKTHTDPGKMSDGDVIELHYMARSVDKDVANHTGPYAVGNSIAYEITFTMPTEVGWITSVTFEDVYPTDLLSFVSEADLQIGSLPKTSVYPTDIAGTISYLLQPSDMTEIAGQTITLTLYFTVIKMDASLINTGAVHLNDIRLDEGVVSLYRLTYHRNGGSGGVIPSAAFYKAGTEVTTAGQGGMTRPDYVFHGWDTEETGIGGWGVAPGAPFTMPAADTDLYAQWTPAGTIVKTVTSTGDTYAVGDEVEYTLYYTLPSDISKITQVRIEDFYTDSLQYVSYTMSIGSSLEYPDFYHDTDTYVLRFSLNALKLAGKEGETIELVLTFKVTSADTSVINNAGLFINGFKVDEDSEPLYRLAYDKNGGSGTEPPSTLHKSGADVTVAEKGDISFGSRNFLGWSTTPTGSVDRAPGSTITITADTVLYAQWQPVTPPPTTPPPPTPTPTETEIPPEDPPLSPFIVEHVAYIIGYPEGDVRPENNITRAEVATVFFRLITDDLRTENWTQENPFTDVEYGQWFNNAISVMSKMEILRGYDDNTFNPNAFITRAEMATIAARFARMTNMDGSNEVVFSDIAGHWAEPDIKYAAKIGWIAGYPEGTFRPDAYITRAEFMTMANRMLERIPETHSDLLINGMKAWSDNDDSGMWYYLAVQEATNSHEPDFKAATVPGLGFYYEFWVEITPNRDWALLEQEWVP